jgi:hypothetical protein
MNDFTTEAPGSSIQTPTTVRPWAAYFFCNATNSGISSRHTRHQVAQKFKITTFPLKSENFTGWPSGSFSCHSGAAVPAKVGVPKMLDACAWDPGAIKYNTTATAAAIERQKFLLIKIGRISISLETPARANYSQAPRFTRPFALSPKKAPPTSNAPRAYRSCRQLATSPLFPAPALTAFELR